MNESMTQAVEIDLKDLFCFAFKHFKMIATISIVFMFVGVGYLFIKQNNNNSVVTADVLDTSVMLPGESDEAYANRVANVERAYDILDNIAVLNNQVEIQNNYICNSVYMQIDPTCTASTRIQVIITCDNSIVGGLESLYKAYSSDITKGEYLNDIADSLNYTPGAVQELISCEFETSDYSLTDNVVQMGTMTICVVGVSIDDTDFIMDAIVLELESKTDSFFTSIAPHSISLVGRQNSFGYDSSVRKTQLDSIAVLNSIQTQILNLNNNLDNIAKTLGFTDRTGFYDSINIPKQSSQSYSIKDFIKYGIVGLLLGLIFAICIYAAIYVFGRRVVSQTQFFSLFGITRIGVCKPAGNRNRLRIALERWSNDDTCLAPADNNALIVANYSNLTSDATKILITGTINSEHVKDTIKELGIEGELRLDLFSDPSLLRDVSKYDGVVLVEQRGISYKKRIAEQNRLLMYSGIRIVGAIIL